MNKRPGVLVHEDDEGRDNTLLMHLQSYLYRKGEYDPRAEQSFAPALCNRIDRNTGGIVIAAKNAAALHHCHFLWLICSAFYIIAKQTILDYLLLLPEPLHEHIAVDAPIGPLVSPFRCEILVVITSPFEISTIAVGA